MSKQVAQQQRQAAATAPKTELKDVQAMDEVIRNARREIAEAEKSDSPIMKALVQARSVHAVRELLTPMMPDIMRLQGNPMGFKTDKDKDGGYPVAVVQDCSTVALLKGYQLVNNEWNIIAGNFYAAKNGCERLVKEFEGLTNLLMTAHVPKVSDGSVGALVAYHATWKRNGVDEELICDIERDKDGKEIGDTRIPVRINQGQGADAILGKAKRKMYVRIYEFLTGTAAPPIAEDILEDDVIEGQSTQSETTQTETLEAQKFREWMEAVKGRFADLSAGDDKGPIKQLYDDSCGPESPYELTAEQHNEIMGWRDAAYETINSRRGENSNNKTTAPKGQQKNFAGVR